jgi:rhamnogalacturonyl hydrolase YesR
MRHKSPKFEKYSWANHFDFASRSGRYTKDESIIVWTVLIGYTFLNAYEFLGDKKYLDVAVSVCEWIMDLPRERTESGTCISYYAFSISSIHNSNMLGAAMLARTAKIKGDPEYYKVAAAAMEYSCSRQLKDGAWYYGEAPNQHWIDNFHTGYNLDSLKVYIESTADNRYRKNIEKGLEFFKSHFFEENGRPKYYHNRTYPVDSQCAAQAIETLANFSDEDPDARNLGIKVSNWTIENMQDPDGHFYYREYPLVKAKTPMLHWGQATTYKGLTRMLSKIINC